MAFIGIQDGNEQKGADYFGITMMEDFISIVTSFCARLYGQRRNRRRTEKLIKELKDDSDK